MNNNEMKDLPPVLDKKLQGLLQEVAKLTAMECQLMLAESVKYPPVEVLRNGKKYILNVTIKEKELPNERIL